MAEDLDVGSEDSGKSNKKKLIIIIAAALLLLVLGGGAAVFFLLGGEDTSQAAAEPTAEQNQDMGASAAGPAIYLQLDPAFVIDFLVNGKQRYLQLNMTVKARDPELVDAIKIYMPSIRNSLVLLFASQSFEELQTTNGKLALKTAAVEAINGILQQESGKSGIEEVLFTNFVMQ